jgi:hypothetical protein
MIWADMPISTGCVGSARQPRQVAEIAVKHRCISNQSSQEEFCDSPIDMKLISGWPIDVRPETGAPVQLIAGIEVLP